MYYNLWIYFRITTILCNTVYFTVEWDLSETYKGNILLYQCHSVGLCLEIKVARTPMRRARHAVATQSSWSRRLECINLSSRLSEALWPSHCVLSCLERILSARLKDRTRFIFRKRHETSSPPTDLVSTSACLKTWYLDSSGYLGSKDREQLNICQVHHWSDGKQLGETAKLFKSSDIDVVMDYLRGFNIREEASQTLSRPG